MSENTEVAFDTVIETVEAPPITFQRLHDQSVRLMLKETGGTIFRQYRYTPEDWDRIIIGLSPRITEAPAVDLTNAVPAETAAETHEIASE